MPRPLRYDRAATIRLTEEERQRLLARARAAGLSLSRYLVETGLATAPLGPEDRALRERALFHLRKLDGHLAQLARRRHAGAPSSGATLDDALRATAQAARRLAGLPDG